VGATQLEELKMPTLKLEIECGEKTCASEPGKFCKWLRTARFGSIWTCQIFCECGTILDGKIYPDSLEEKDGWIQRHPECLKNCSQKKSDWDEDAKRRAHCYSQSKRNEEQDD
jgi:hypothetical protein